jgi:hypothetical protein
MPNKRNRGTERCIFTTKASHLHHTGQCTEYEYSRGLCWNHYKRVRKLILAKEYSWKQLEDSGKVLNRKAMKTRQIEAETRDYLEGRG